MLLIPQKFLSLWLSPHCDIISGMKRIVLCFISIFLAVFMIVGDAEAVTCKDHDCGKYEQGQPENNHEKHDGALSHACHCCCSHVSYKIDAPGYALSFSVLSNLGSSKDSKLKSVLHGTPLKPPTSL